jgi:F-type H+-transporting ATPase subunit beta
METLDSLVRAAQPGTSLTIDETISAFRDLLAGRYDHLPVETLRFTGRIEEK